MDNRHLLFNRSLLTDHKNLIFLVNSQSERVIRYKMALQAFGNWVHVPDKSRALIGPDAFRSESRIFSLLLRRGVISF